MAYHIRDKAGRKKHLSKEIEKVRADNKVKAVLEICICPICKCRFNKMVYQQVFCSPKCHDKYHNLRYK